MTDFTIVLRSLTTRRFSTIVTALTVAVAVALLLILLSLKDSGQRAFQRGSGDMHLLVSAGGEDPLSALLSGVFYTRPPRKPLEWATWKQIESGAVLRPQGQTDGPPAPWAYAIPRAQGDSFRGFAVIATSEDFFTKFKPNSGEDWSFAVGKRFEKSFEVVLGSRVANELQLKLNDEVYLTHGFPSLKDATNPLEGGEDGSGDAADDHDHDHAHGDHEHREFPYRVVGILAPTGGSHDHAVFTDLESTWIIHAHERREREDSKVKTTTAADLQDEDRKITGVYIRLLTRDGSDTPANLGQVFSAFARDPRFTVAQPAQELGKLFRIVGNINTLFVAIAGVVLVSSGISIMLALYNSMEQRRRQIAVLRVLGASRGRIFGLVITESAVLGLLGAVSGVVLGIVGLWVASAILKANTGIIITPELSARGTVTVAMATVALACLAGVVPAALAYRTGVANNLKPLG